MAGARFWALERRIRRDKGVCRAISPEDAEAIIKLRLQQPGLAISTLIRQLEQSGVSELGTFSLSSVYQLLAREGLDRPRLIAEGSGTCAHLQVVCANLKIKLVHARPHAAWSRGKIERFFRTVQGDFQLRLRIAPVHDLEVLNARLWQWLENEFIAEPTVLWRANIQPSASLKRPAPCASFPAIRIGNGSF